MSQIALSDDELRALAAFGEFAETPAWYVTSGSVCRLHHSPDCRTLAKDIPTPTTLGELASVAAAHSNVETCNLCRASAPVPVFGHERTYDIDRSLLWLEAAAMRLRQQPAGTQERLTHHRELQTLYRIAETLEPDPNIARAVRSATGRIAADLDRGRELGVERRTRWADAAEAIAFVLVDRRTDGPQWLRQVTGLTEHDLKVYEEYRNWVHSYGAPICPVELTDLDQMADHAFATWCWARFGYPNLMYGSASEPALYADVVFDHGRRLIGRIPYLWAARCGRYTEVLGGDDGYTVEEVRTAAAVDLAGATAGGLAAGIAVLRTAAS